MCCFTCGSVLVLWFCDGLSNVSCDVFFFFCESLQCSGFFAVDVAEGPDACAKSKECACARWVQLRYWQPSSAYDCRSRQSCCPGDAPQFALLLRYDTTTSMRPFGHSTGQLLWTDVGLSTTRQEGAATRICASVHSREHHQRRAGACDQPNWAGGYSHGDHSEKQRTTIHYSRRLRIHATTSNFKIKPLSFGHTLG